MNEVVFTKDARQDLKNIELYVAQRIIKKIVFFARQKNPLLFAKKLAGITPPKYRFRVGDYRVIFKIGPKHKILVLFILRIKHRKDVYGP